MTRSMLVRARLRLMPRFDRLFDRVRFELVAWNVGIFFLLLAAIGTGVYLYFSSQIYHRVDSDLVVQEQVVKSRLEGQFAYLYSPVSLLQNQPGLVSLPYRVVGIDQFGNVMATPECQQYPSSLPVGGNSPIHCAADSSQPTSRRGVYAVFAALANSGTPWQPGQPTRIEYVTDLRSATFRNAPWRVLTVGVRVNNQITGAYQIARDVSGEQDSLREVGLLLILAGVAGVILSGLSSLFLAGRALVPIRQAFHRQRQFTADASHELRTPLALIRANAEMLYRHADRLPQTDSDLIGEIIGETDHLNRLVGDLLTLARADADALRLASTPVDFRNLVAGVTEDLGRIAETQGIRTTLSLNGPVTVQGDEGRLRQLLLILLDNSLKYTDPGGSVSVSLGKEDNRARLIVADTGIGIPAEDVPHVFKRFYRVDRAREHESGGTGLGLAIADWIVRAHHGQIRVESTVGKGSTFKIDLPAS